MPMSNPTPTQASTITVFTASDLESHLPALTRMLQDCVAAGASISFLMPFPAEQAEAFWRGNVLPALQSGTRSLLVALQDGQLAGSVQLDYDTPPNQPHRAEVRKLMVHPQFRRLGIAKALMRQLETLAGELNRTLLTLDTRSGSEAEPLYIGLGYQVVGQIPDYALDAPESEAGRGLHATTIMYKQL